MTPLSQERVFGGEFDWIASDDEGSKEEARSELVIAGLETKSKRSSGDQEDSSFSITDEDQDVINGLDYGLSCRVTISDPKCTDELPEETVLSDPYAGIFFSKDRIEKIIEIAEEDEWLDISPFPRLSTKAAQGENMRVRVMSMGDWMKGCPEGSELIAPLLTELRS